MLKKQSPLVFDCLPRQRELPEVIQDELVFVYIIDFFIDFVPNFFFVHSTLLAIAVDWYQCEWVFGVALVLHELVIRVWLHLLVHGLEMLLGSTI